MLDFLSSEESLALNKISLLAEQLNIGLWVVGGVIRDSLLGAPNRLADIDLVVEGNAADFSSVIAKEFHAENKIFSDFLTAKVIGIPAIGTLDLASTRREKYEVPGALPIVTLGSFQEDCFRRDFSINALYVRLIDFISMPASSLREKIIDHVSGLIDLESKLIRILHDNSFVDDPTRLFRACRYSVKIGGHIENKTQALFTKAVSSGCLYTISYQRILNELQHACSEGNWNKVLIEFSRFELLTSVALLDDHQKERFENLLTAIHLDLNLAERYEYLTAILFFLCLAENREDRFRRFGFGKKFFKRMNSIRAGSLSSNDSLINMIRASFEHLNLNLA